MNNNDFTDEIPLRAFLNAVIIDKAVELPAFQQCIDKVMKEAGSPSSTYDFKNPAYIVELLYCLIVVTKQKWISDENDPIYTKPPISELPHYFSVIKNDDANSAINCSHKLIRHLRNAIAHARFSVDNRQDFEFWDQKNDTAEPNWRVRISNESLFKVINAMANTVIDMRGKKWDLVRHADHS